MITRRGMLLRGAGLAAGALAAAAASRAGTVRARLTAATQDLTPQQLAGQRVIYSYPGYTPPATLFSLISAGQAAGVIFFGENIKSDGQIASVIGQFSQASQQSPVPAPLLLMTDQEGGLVRRLKGQPANSEKEIGSSADPISEAAKAGAGAGRNLQGVGMNVNLAPVLGVYRQAGDFLDQFQRSYSMDPAICAECGAAMISAQQQTGVAATAKHFPGLGAATSTQNTDEGPVTLNLSLSDLRSIDEYPYPPAVSAGVKLVMCSWAVYPALDPTYPAGLSQTIVRGELRSRIGFTGVTITDALEAGALQAFGDTGQRAVAAAAAGMDAILCSARDVSQGQAAVAALAGAYSSGQLDPSQFQAEAQRVTALRASLL
ncbi:MAG: beta-N-acetylhexosaminidase [Actinobacteria bacterium]|nr:beta-N-acetylhexosaminidase [Actinomycetota bacterium]